MKQKFLSSLFLIVLLNLLIKPFYILGVDAEVQNRVLERQIVDKILDSAQVTEKSFSYEEIMNS